jgi:hypothetical protein
MEQVFLFEFFVCNKVIISSQVRTDCKFRFREAALIDNYNSDFAFPSCLCTKGTFRKGKPLKKYIFNNFILTQTL